MPAGADILKVNMTADGAMLWASVDPTQPSETRYLVTRATGEEYEADVDIEYLGTVFAGITVWHVFEVEAPL